MESFESRQPEGDEERLPVNPEKDPLYFAITNTEAYQLDRRTREPEKAEAAARYFLKHPDIRESFVSNPFDPSAQELIKGVDRPQSLYETLRSAILVEPKGEYEHRFQQLPRSEKSQELSRQIEISADMTIRLQKYVEKNLSEIDGMSDAELYKELLEEAFETVDNNKIQFQYALSQRRGFRLSIVNFLEGRKELASYGVEASADPKAFAEKYLKKKFKGDVAIESLPIGFVIYLDEEDYALSESERGDPRSVISEGKTIVANYLPQELNGRIVVVNRNSDERGDQLVAVKKHEIKHILFGDFHSEQNHLEPENVLFDIAEEMHRSYGSTSGEQAFRNLADVWLKDMVERAKDEIVAYFDDEFLDNVSYPSLGFISDRHRDFMDRVKTQLSYNHAISEEDKERLLDHFVTYRRQAFENIKELKLVADRMYRRAVDESERNKFAALLHNTPGNRIRRISGYAGLTADEIKKEIKLGEERAISDWGNILDENFIQKLLSTAGEPISKDDINKFRNRFLDAKNEMLEHMPIEGLPIILEGILRFSEPPTPPFMTKAALLLLEYFIKINGIMESERGGVKEALLSSIDKLGPDEEYAESHHLVGKLLAQLSV